MAASLVLKEPYTAVTSSHSDSWPNISIRHPGYTLQNELLRFSATDRTSAGTYGVQYAVIHTACAIVADSRFDGYLSKSAEPTDTTETQSRIHLGDNELLDSGTYFFHVPAPQGM